MSEFHAAAAAAAKLLQSCPTLCNAVDCSPPGSSIRGISQARILEWGAIAFSVSSMNYLEMDVSLHLNIPLKIPWKYFKLLPWVENFLWILLKVQYPTALSALEQLTDLNLENYLYKTTHSGGKKWKEKENKELNFTISN